MGNALAVSEHNYALYASEDSLYVLKSPVEKWRDEINTNIAGLKSGQGGIYLRATSSIIADDLKRVEGSPKGLIIISDFEVCGEKGDEKTICKELFDRKIYPFLIAIGEEHEENAREMVEDLGEEHYSSIPTNKIEELPEEVFRLFKTYGISR